MTILIASGTSLSDLSGLNQYDAQFSEGDIQELHLNFSAPLAADLASLLTNELYARFNENFVSAEIQNDTRVVIKLRVAVFPVWVAIGAFIAGALVIAALFFVSWLLYRNIPGATFGGISGTLLLGGIAVVAAVLLLRRGSG